MPVVAAIRRWLEGAFPESNVRLEEDTSNGISRFLIEERAGGRARVFEVAATTVHTDPEEVVRYLDEQRVAHRLRESPTWRARLGPGEVLEYFQQVHVRCDGKSYVVIQTADRQLIVMDARHRRLTKAPTADATFNGDIAAVPAKEWHQQIRAWRGADQ